ncbi:MAG: hypothetical protein WBA05_17925, partial [Gordonia sp. (in: high G+C Gram-positive bacteria)]
NGRAVTTLLRRHAPALRAIGWTVDDDGGRNHSKSLQWTITPAEQKRISDPQHPRHPQRAADQQKRGAESAGQGAGQTNAGNPQDPHAGQRGSDENVRPAPDPHRNDSKPAGQMGSAGVAGVAGVKYASAPLTSAPRGGNSASSPGQTDRVAAAVARSRAANPACRYCNEPLEFADDKRDGFHSSNTKCLTAWKKDNR